MGLRAAAATARAVQLGHHIRLHAVVKTSQKTVLILDDFAAHVNVVCSETFTPH
jgi:hypothetical protein